jgi:hypothetical protein
MYKIRFRGNDQYLKKQLNNVGYWKEIGAVILTLPRRTGKSIALREFGEWLERNKGGKIIIVNAFKSMKKLSNEYYASEFHTIRGRHQPENHHLLIDEYDYIKSDIFDILLDAKWKSVIMVGTKK